MPEDGFTIDIGSMRGDGDTEDLADELQRHGYHIEAVDRVQITEAVGEPPQVLLWVSEHPGEDILSALVRAVIVWAKSRFHGRSEEPKEVKVILDSNGQVLKRVEIDAGADA